MHVVAGVEGSTDAGEHDPPPGLAVTVYLVIVAPPSDEGAVHETTLCALAPLVAVTLVGAPGTTARMKTVALPNPASSPLVPTTAVVPSSDNATEFPKLSFAVPSLFVIVCCCVHVEPEREKIVALP